MDTSILLTHILKIKYSLLQRVHTLVSTTKGARRALTPCAMWAMIDMTLASIQGSRGNTSSGMVTIVVKAKVANVKR